MGVSKCGTLQALGAKKPPSSHTSRRAASPRRAQPLKLSRASWESLSKISWESFGCTTTTTTTTTTTNNNNNNLLLGVRLGEFGAALFLVR